ncbi:uncharacterized protein LOC125491002 [Plutella xylostella]|uniref:uncharacterized protein LOC125491002 n=1 Tax=Plutella xylostella TaxID=51655 RepID=UPI0020322409|nr:uncharacterized protein LOC125491002 [Plutella xylostella]
MSGRASRPKKRREPSSKHRKRCRDDSHRNQYCPSRDDALDTIIGRLSAIEDRLSSTPASMTDTLPARDIITPPLPTTSAHTDNITITSVESANRNANTDSSIVSALSSLLQVRSGHYYISNFDPDIHDFDVWCAEVDRGRELNRWDDRECLSRIGGCLLGQARTWLNSWTSDNRTWTNFKVEFRSLCPRNIDIANILFDVMCTNSNNFRTYAEYARKTILRLNIVKGLSDELKTAIVIRGIVDVQVKAAAANGNLTYHQLVDFLSVYCKPNHNARSTRNIPQQVTNNDDSSNMRKRGLINDQSGFKCYNCGGYGHRRWQCSKRQKMETNETVTNSTTTNDPQSLHKTHLSCTFCGKIGHSVQKCFVKQRTETNNNGAVNVNFCRKNDFAQQSNVMSAVVEKVPVDVLIDSGSDISLISKSVLKHIKCNQVPTYRLMRGIGSQEIESVSYVTTVVEFPEISVEVDLYVVPSESMSVPLLLGTDVLNRKGVTYIRRGDSQRLTRDQNEAQVHHLRALDTVAINTPLVGDNKNRLLSLLNEFSDTFITGTAMTTVNTGCMEIKLNSNNPVHYRPYKLSADEKVRVKEITDDLLDKGIIRESQSEYASPIILVKKRDGSDRMCVDYRALNAITVKDRFPLPLIDDHIDKLGKAKFFSSCDMASGFHQVPMKDDESISKTAFVTPENHFEYLKMPYGLTNAPVVYQKIISKTLKSLIDTGKVLTYIDDVLIMSESIDEGLELLRQVLETLSAAGFSINLKKCVFLDTEVEYLGRLISQGQKEKKISFPE